MRLSPRQRLLSPAALDAPMKRLLASIDLVIAGGSLFPSRNEADFRL
jgi:hypothetical protein